MFDPELVHEILSQIIEASGRVERRFTSKLGLVDPDF